MESTARKLVAKEKGILAADWSFGTAEKKFAGVGIKSTKETRRAYRQMLFTTPGLEEFVSGVIFFDETIKQKTDQGKLFPQVLEEKGIIPGIRVDIGQVDMPGFPGEKISEGLDGLRERLKEYKKLGAKFAKWRAVYFIDKVKPTRMCISANTELHALYALLCQEEDIVPIVEPDILIAGDHSIRRCREVTEEVLRSTFLKLLDYGVDRKKMLLKPSMVLPGKEAKVKSDSKEVAKYTLEVMKSQVPVDVPGIVFLSGGQTPEKSTENLNEISKIGGVPWETSFSYARAIQGPVLEAWKGMDENVQAAQKILLQRAKLNSLARQGKYDVGMEK